MKNRKSLSPTKAIRIFCFECMGMDRRNPKAERPYEDVQNCTDFDCPLYDFRFGKNPHHGRAGNKTKARLKEG